MFQNDRVNMNTRELLGRIITGPGGSGSAQAQAGQQLLNNNNSAANSVTPVTERGSGSTTESAEINFLEAIPSIDR